MDFTKDANLKRIRDKVFYHERLNEEDGQFILESNDILHFGMLADKVRREKVGDYVTFVNNYHICFTNICKNNCYHCKFRKKEKDEHAFLLTMDEIREKAEEAKKLKVPEVLFMGGIHPTLKFDYYVNALKAIKEIIPDVLILAFSAVEINNFCKIESKGITEILSILKDAGLTAFTGGGVDILDDRYIKKLRCDESRLNAEKWISIHKAAHDLSIATNACMIYGVGESCSEVVENMTKLRSLQDETGGFTHFFPYGYSEFGNKMTDGLYDLKMLILARLYLDNFDHIRVYWGYVGKRLAQVSLTFGVDDLNGVRQKGRIIHTTGNIKAAFSDEEEMKRIISGTGKIPAERDILFNRVRTFG
jgi:aminodeoxyfutalosine synthase